MAKYRYIDFECESCGHREERFLHFEGEEPPEQRCQKPDFTREAEPEEKVFCSLQTGATWVLCNGVMREMDACARIKTIVKGNHDYNERERARLEKRSHEHFLRKGRDEAVDRERMLTNKYKKQAGL